MKLDLYYTVRQKRLALQREADKLEQVEKDILYELTAPLSFSKHHQTLNEGPYTMTATAKPFVIVEDWDAALKFIKENEAVDMLQRRVTESAVMARWDDGITVPGMKKDQKWAVKIERNPS